MGKQRILDFFEGSQPQENPNTPKPLKPIGMKEVQAGVNPLGDKGFVDTLSSQQLSRTIKNDRKVKDYLPYVPNLNLEAGDVDEVRAENQGWGEQLSNSLTQFGAGVLGGAALSLGTTLDVDQAIGTLAGTQKEFGNVFTDFGHNIMEAAKEVAPIYQKAAGDFNPSDSGWWYQMVADSGLSAGIMAYSALEATAIGALTAGVGEGLEAGLIGSRLATFRRFVGLAEASTEASKLRRTATLFGMFNRHNEGLIEAADSFQTTYDDLVRRGVSDDDARTAGAKAAQATYLGNLPLMALDMLQFRAMTFNPISGGSTGGLVEGLLEGVGNKTAQKAVGHTLGVLSEGGEEYWQALVQDESKHYADGLVGKGDDSTFGERFKQFNAKGETWNATVSGIFGGLTLGGITHGISKLTKGQTARELNRNYANFITSTSGMGLDMVNDIRAAEEEGNDQKANNLRRKMGIHKAMQAVHLDNLKDETTAFDTYNGFLTETLAAANSGDAQKIAAAGLTGSEDFIKSNFPNYISDANEMKSIYEEAKLNNQRDAVPSIAYRRFMLNNLNREKNATDAEIGRIQANMPDLDNASNPGRVINEAQINIKLWEEQLKSINSQLKNDKLKSEEKDALLASQMNANFAIEQNKKEIEDQQEFVNNLSETEKANDAEILRSVNDSARLQTLMYNRVDLEKNINRFRKEVNTWTNKEFQKKNAREKIFHLINDAQSLPELSAVIDSLNEQGIATDTVRAKLEEKRKELQAREEADSIKDDNPDPAANQPGISPMEAAMNGVPAEEAPDPGATISTPFGETAPITAEDIASTFSAERAGLASSLFEPGDDFMPTDAPEPRVEESPDVNTPPTPKPKTVYEKGVEAIGLPPLSTDSQEEKDAYEKRKEAYLNGTFQPVTTPLENSEVSPQATIVNEQSLFAPNPISSNFSDTKKAAIKSQLADYYNSLYSALGTKPTFKQLVEDLIEQSSPDMVDNNWNIITTGWELNEYPATNFTKVYDELFGSRKSKADAFFQYIEDNNLTETEQRAELEQEDEKFVEEQAPPVQIKETETGEKVYVNMGEFQTVESTLKFAHLSQPYTESIESDGNLVTIRREDSTDSLNQSDYVDSAELMNPNLYAAGTELSARVPETGVDNIPITIWNKDFTAKRSIPFGEWAVGKDKNSDEYIGRIPMIIYNKDGKGVAFVHDVDWYNPLNIGFGEAPGRQAEIIAAAKEELLAFRKSALQGNNKITITEKRPGTKMVIPRDKPTITVAQANPDARLGFVNDNGNLETQSGVVSFDELLNATELERGHKYELRQAGLDKNGKPTYLATKVMYEPLTADVQSSLVQAMSVYMSQFDTTEKFANKAQMDLIQSQVKKATGLDLRDQADLEAYLNQFVQTYKGKAKQPKAIADVMESNPNIINGTPWIAISEGKLVFGIKGEKLSQSAQAGYTLYIHPQNFSKGDVTLHANLTTQALTRIFRGKRIPGSNNYIPDFLAVMKQNMNRNDIVNNTPVYIIKADGQSSSPVPYNDYLKTKLKTNLRSLKLPDGTYASFSQPVIQFDYDRTIPLDKTGTPSPVGRVEQLIAETVATATGQTTAVPISPEAAIINDITANLEAFSNLGLSEEAMAALKGLSREGSRFAPNYDKLTDAIVDSMKVKLTKVADLNTIDRNTVVQFVANQIMYEIDPQKRNTINKAELRQKINESFNAIVGPKIDLVNAKIAPLQQLFDTGKYPALGTVISEFKNLQNNAEVLKANWNFLVNEAFEDYISKFTGIEVTMSRDQKTVDVAITDEDAAQDLVDQEEDQQEFSIESNDQREKDYSKESVEDNGKASTSYLLKRFLAQIPNYDKSGKPKQGYMGLTTFPGFDYYYNVIGAMLSSPSPAGSSMESVMIRLQQHAESQPWVKELMTRLENADDQLKNSFMYNFSRETLSMKFVMTSFDNKTGTYKLKVYDTNANEITRVIQTQWRENFKQSPLVLMNGENYGINVAKAQELLTQFNNWIATKTFPDAATTQKWLSNFGIELSSDAIKDLIDNGYYVKEGTKNVQYPFNKMFQKSESTSGLMGNLAFTLERMISAENKDFQENDSVNPFENMSGILNKLTNIESKYTLNVTTNSFRDGSKSIYGFTPSKFATSFLNELKNNPQLLADKKEIPFDQNSYLMYLLENDPDFKEKFSIDHIGINAFKELGTALYQDNELNGLADSDHELVKLGMFQDSQQGEVKSRSITIDGVEMKVPMRMARMLFPTMSDKKTMLDLTTAVLNLNSKDFEFAENGAVTIDPVIKQFLFSQLIEPEIKRIVDHHRRAADNGIHPNKLNNQKGYNLGAQIFHLIPAMNNVTVENNNGEQVRLTEYIATMGNLINGPVYDKMMTSITQESHKLLDDLFTKLYNDKIASWDNSGFFDRKNSESPEEITGSKFLDNKYMNKKTGTVAEKVRVAALDYVINSALTNANTHMLIAGDVANYSQDKAFKGRVEVDSLGNALAYRPLTENAYSTMSEDIIGVNLGKRLALLIAPGQTISQSKNDKYVQLFLQDRVSVSQNIEYLIQLYHGAKAVSENKDAIDAAKAGDINAQKSLMNKFSDLDAYFAIESTDAQEYTTAKEHLDIQYRQGRITVDIYNSAMDKIQRQKEAERKGQAIPEDALLSKKEMDIIFQPIKPVYTGQLQDKKNGVSRMMYIKSSSFPLIPQVTKAFPGLDRLRQNMEDIETKQGMNVRASYDTANKVGAVFGSRQLDIWNEDGSFNEGAFDTDGIVSKLRSGDDTSALVLDRQFFRIQQDVPFKSTKKEQQDEITLGTQMMKIMFGDGVGQITDAIFDMNGKKISGSALQDQYNERFQAWIGNEKSRLYESLGIDEATGQAIDKSKTVQKLQNILQQEAKKRGYPKQDVEALELDSDGNLKTMQFTIPLWLSPNSNRYEALLNAIVTNRLLNLSLPGASFVAGSEEGFRTTSDLNAVDTSKVIWTNSWTGELKGAVDENGFKTAQVLVPSKFRDTDGKLLDLFKKDSSGEYIYVNQEDNGKYTLKESMMDKDLLSLSSFRIPTSSHVSLSQIEIVGILPVEAGDLMIVPKNFTKQKGLDFDVDKENTYWLHHGIDENGKVVKLEDVEGINAGNVDEFIADTNAGLQMQIERFAENKELIQGYKDELELMDTYPVMADMDKKHVIALIKDLKVDVSKEEIKKTVAFLKHLKDLKTKLNQNEIIKVYSSVLSNGDTRIQKKINKVLSTDFAEGQANLIDGMIKSSQDNSLFTILSDEYQKAKMGLGAAGKLGIGVYSNYVVLHSLIQQSRGQIRLMTTEFDDDGNPIRVPYALQIGDVASNGMLGRIETLDGARSITDVNAERQNTATDNEKLQIMGKTGINEVTINVDAVLSIMGFDQSTAIIDGKKQPVSIPYMLMSQPVIREYVDMIRATRSNIAEFNPTAEADVVAQLTAKYLPEGHSGDFTPQDTAEGRKALTGQKLVDNILDNGQDGVSQIHVLNMFLELKGFGEDVSKLQSRLNIQRSGLGKSIFEMIHKYENVAKLEYMNSIDGISNLIGNYVTGQDFMDQDTQDLIDDGYIIFNDDKSKAPFAVKPTTATGSLVLNASKAGYQLWADYFPHTNAALKQTIDEIIGLSSSKELEGARKIQLQTEVFQELKKYLNSSSQTGMFEGNPQDERERLFFDRNDNQSLASYLKDFLKSDNANKDLIANNKLISRFNYTLEKGALPSLIKFDNGRGEDFNEEYKYLALVELMDKNVPLANYNGKPYTSRMLAKDLISYTFLQGGVQQAIEFVKYVPVAYLKAMGFADTTQLWQRSANGELMLNSQGQAVDTWGLMLGSSILTDDDPTTASRFAKQWAQHNPKKLGKITEEDMDKDSKVFTPGSAKLYDLQSFVPILEVGETPAKFKAVYNKETPKGMSKLQVYQFDGKRYNRVPNLGIFGMAEYSIRDNDVKPLISQTSTKVVTEVQAPVVTQQPLGVRDTFDMVKGNLTTSLQKIDAANFGALSTVVKTLMPLMNNSTKLLIGDTPNGRAIFQGNTITIDPAYMSSHTDFEVAETLVHEYIHSLTAPIIETYYDSNGAQKNIELSPAMKRLERLYKEVNKQLGTEIEEFKQWYQKNPGKIRNADDLALYAGMDMHEFTAMILTEPRLLAAMQDKEYMSSGKNLVQQFVFAIREVLKELGLISTETFDAALESVYTVVKEQQDNEQKTKGFDTFGFSQGKVDTQDTALGNMLDKEDMNDKDQTDLEGFMPAPTDESEVTDDNCIF